jgi:hypothetical protein
VNVAPRKGRIKSSSAPAGCVYRVLATPTFGPQVLESLGRRRAAWAYDEMTGLPVFLGLTGRRLKLIRRPVTAIELSDGLLITRLLRVGARERADYATGVELGEDFAT